MDTESIKVYPVNIPPLSEQNKIAKILPDYP
ncbi:restriction endonuclease subunit S [Aeromonas sanarellii]|nr:restriction endonuclease subunit S [Aeromonas sanarellii]